MLSWAAARGAAGRWTVPARVAACLCAVGVASGLAFALQASVPVLSLGALYTLAVLPVAVAWGMRYALLVAILSVVTFNYLFLPPVLTFTLHGGENWVVFAVYLITGLAASDLAARARRRAREAEQREREAAFLAELSSVLLAGAEVVDELPRIAEETGRLLDAPGARVALGGPTTAAEGEAAIELVAGDRTVATFYAPRGSSRVVANEGRFLAALAAVLGIALDRERLAREAFAAEALRQSDLLKTALLRSVSHDLRSPLTAIKASLEALASAELTLEASQRDTLLADALAELDRLDRTVRNLLDLSRLQAGAVRAEPRLRTIDGLVDQALTHVPWDGQRLELSAPPDLPLVRVDPIQIEHALANLLENALKFSPPGSPVRVEIEPAQGELIVRVLDEGPGLAPGELARIFEPFSRGSTTPGARGGAGLGLAIAKGFIEANGGRLWAERREGGGACFLVALPTTLDGAVAVGA